MREKVSAALLLRILHVEFLNHDAGGCCFPFTLKDIAGSGCDFSHCLSVGNVMAN